MAYELAIYYMCIGRYSNYNLTSGLKFFEKKKKNIAVRIKDQ